MGKLDELQVIAEADVVLHCVGSRKEGVLNYGMTDRLQTPLGRIGISFDVIQLREVVGSGYDLDIWYPSLYVAQVQSLESLLFTMWRNQATNTISLDTSELPLVKFDGFLQA